MNPPVNRQRSAWNVIVIAVLVVALLISLGFLARALRQNRMWEGQVTALSMWHGSARAQRDFKAGGLRLFVVAGEQDDDKFAGTNDGPFEIWHPQYYPSSYPMRYSTELMVEFYNSEMRSLHEAHAKLDGKTNTATPLGKP